ncbi:MAG: replication-relaxation family protein [Pseudomonadota bacterium]
METLSRFISSESLPPSALRRDHTPSTSKKIDEGLWSRRRATGWESEELSWLDENILWCLVSVRVMTRDQIKKLWYPKGTIRAVNWRLKKLKDRKLIEDLPAGSIAQAVWTFTARGLGALQEVLAWKSLVLPFEPPIPRRIRESTIRHQLAVAEVFVGAIQGETVKAQIDALATIRWQDGWRRRLEYTYGAEERRLYPDVYFGVRGSERWYAYLEIDRGTEDGTVLRETFEKYGQFFCIGHRGEQPPTLIFICPGESRRDFVRKIFESVSPTYRSKLQSFRAFTMAESVGLLKRYMAVGSFLADLKAEYPSGV